MDLFSINLSTSELAIIRQSLDVITINGKDARLLANLQNKLDQEITSVQQFLQQAENKKQLELKQALVSEAKKAVKASTIS